MSETCELCKTATLKEVPKGWYKEIKLDGIRCLYIKGQLINRHGQNITKDFPEISLAKKNIILDGEIVIFDGTFRTDFNRLQNHKNNKTIAHYVAFDILEYEGKSLTNLPLKTRRTYLPRAKTIHLDKNFLIISDLPSLNWNDVKLCHLEGLIFKNPESYYEFRRSANWLKVKNWKEIELDINSYEITEGEKGNAGFVIYVGKDNQKVAICSPEDRIKIGRGLDKREKMKAIIQYLEKTKDGALRFPSFKELK